MKGHVVQPGCHYPVQITEGDALVATADSSGDFAAELTVGDHALVLASEPRLELPSISIKYDDLTDLGMIQMRVQTGRVAGRVVVTGAGNPTSASTCDLPWPGFTSTLTLSGPCDYSMTVGPPGTYSFEAVGVGDYRLTVTTPPSAG